jgi:hypothetical protein
VRCTVPLAVAKARYQARHRHAGHLDPARDDAELWGEPSRPLGICPEIEVDTSGPADIPGLAARLARVLGGDKWL